MPAATMTELEEDAALDAAWLQALDDADAPAGPDLEYDNDFLALTQAAAGKPETQFAAAEPPDWRGVRKLAESMMARTRDLRVAVLWVRALVRLDGFGGLLPGLKLLDALVTVQWAGVHPLPDPDDGDPYARVNALTVLGTLDGLLGDVRTARLVQDRALADLTARAVELALGLAPAAGGEPEPGRGAVEQMLAAAIASDPALRTRCGEIAERARQLNLAIEAALGGEAPDLQPLVKLLNGIVTLLPPDPEAEAEAAGEAGGGAAGAGGAAPARGLAGSVNSREDAIRAIDMVCAYLSRAEPTNPAPLFLKRARQLISHDFLQLLKVLAPDALPEVARIVGVDPDSIESPDGA
jgi:type VI secretion system protein ImpA